MDGISFAGKYFQVWPSLRVLLVLQQATYPLISSPTSILGFSVSNVLLTPTTILLISVTSVLMRNGQRSQASESRNVGPNLSSTRDPRLLARNYSSCHLQNFLSQVAAGLWDHLINYQFSLHLQRVGSDKLYIYRRSSDNIGF